MSFWSKLNPFHKKQSSLELFREIYGSREVRSGVNVNWKTAIEVSAVMRCAAVIADGISTVPFKLMISEGDNRRQAVDHPLHRLLSYAANEWQDSLQFRETIALHVVLVGNAYVFKFRVRGKIDELVPIEPGRVEVKQERDGTVRYFVTNIDGERQEFSSDDIWHIKGPSWNNVMGLESVKLAREAIGLSMALEGSHASLHKNGVQSTGVYSIEGNLTDDQYQRLRKHIDSHAAGIDNTGKPLILDRSAKWQSMMMTGVDAQHLETRKYQVEEICRFFGVNPIMVGYSDKAATYASAEQMFLAHAVHTIRPWHRRFEASAKRNLLTDDEWRKGYYFRFIDAELLRGAAKDRAEFYSRGIQSGWITRNEVRGWEEMEPIDGLDKPLVPLNMLDGTKPDGQGAGNGN